MRVILNATRSPGSNVTQHDDGDQLTGLDVPCSAQNSTASGQRCSSRVGRRDKESAGLFREVEEVVGHCAEGATNNEVARRLGVNQATVCKWRGRFVTRGLEGLADEPRPGAARTITDDDVKRVIVKTLEETPADATPLVDPVDGQDDGDVSNGGT